MPRSILAALTAEADAAYPYETGGVLIGHLGADESEIMVTAVYGPGRQARHARHGFKPDHDFLNTVIAREHDASNGRDIHLGDWHSDPDTQSGDLGLKDRLALRTITTHADARMPCPLICVLRGRRGQWDIGLWRGDLMPTPLGWSRFVVREMAIRTP